MAKFDTELLKLIKKHTPEILDPMNKGRQLEYRCKECKYFDDEWGYGFCENADSDYSYVNKEQPCCREYKFNENR